MTAHARRWGAFGAALLHIGGATLAVSAALIDTGCGGTRALPLNVGLDHEEPEAPVVGAKPAAEAAPPLDPDVVAKAERPYFAVDRAGRTLSASEFVAAIAEAELLCLGEQHDDAHDHYVQWHLLDELRERATVSGRRLAVGLEMVERPGARTLEKFQSRSLELRDLPSALDWKRTWGFDFALYSPVFLTARDASVPLLALNLERTLSKAAAHGTLAELAETEERKLPEAVPGPASHRASFERMMSAHPAPSGGRKLTAAQLDAYYTAQVLKDETLADGAASWLRAHAPAGQLLLLAGSAHCRHDAVPARAERRGVRAALSIELAHGSTQPPAKPSEGAWDYAVVVGEPE